MKNLYNKTKATATMWLLLLLAFSGISKAQDGVTTAFAFGGGMSAVDEMRYASDGNLYFVARLGGKNTFAGNNYDAGGYGQYPLQQWVYGKVSPSGQQTLLKVFERNVDNNNLYNSMGNNHVIDKDGNLFSIATGTFPGNDYGNGFVETGYGAKIIKTSNTGTVQWVKAINTGVNINYGEAGTTLPNVNGLQVMNDGSIYTIMTSNNQITDSGSPYFEKYPTRIIKYNSSGDEVWHHEMFSGRNGLSFVVNAPKQFVANNGSMVVNIVSTSDASFISQGTTLTATHPTSFGSYYNCLMGLDNTGARTWFQSTTWGVSLKAVDPNSATVYASYGYTGGNNTPPPIAPYSSLPNLNTFTSTYTWSGMLKLDIATGNITNSTPTIPVPNSLRFLTSAEKLHVRSDGSLIFYAHKTAFSVIGNYMVPDNYNALIFTDANYNVTKVAQANIEKVELIAENSTNFAFADDFKTAITLGGNTLTPFLIDTDFGTRFPLYASVKADSYIAQGTISQIASPKTTTWTGATSTAWNDTGNWSNGIADISTTAIFDTNTANQPTVTAATTVGRLVINNGVIVSLPTTNLTIKDKLQVNGTLKILVSGFTYFTGYNAGAIEGNGTIEFNGTGSATMAYVGSLSNQLGLKTNVNLYASGTYKTVEFVGSAVKITGNLTITNTDVNAITGTSATNYIVGNLTRNITSATSYNFPVGTSDYYLPVSINTNNITGTNSITVEPRTSYFTKPDINLGDATINRVTDNGNWIITPNIQPTSGKYSITLNKNNATNGDSDATKYVILKTTPTGTLYNFEGSLGNRSQTGGTVSGQNLQNSEITVSQSDLESFGNFIIAVATAPIAEPLTVTASTWTGTSNTDWNNAANWTGGVPTSTVNAVIPSGLTNYPLVYSATKSYLKSLTIDAGVNVNLSNRLIVSDKIVNNGIITVNITPNTNSALPVRAALNGSGKVVLEKPPLNMDTGDMDCDLDINIGNANTFVLNAKFGGNINIISGQIFGNVTPTSATSTIQITAPINNIAGRIWKTVTGSGTYYFPIGNESYSRPAPYGGRKYGEISITNNGIANVSQYVVWFDAYTIDAVAVGNGTDFYAGFINSGQWNVQPNGVSPSGTLDLVLKTSDYTNGRADINDYVLLRKNPSGTWAVVSGATFSQNAGMITVTANGLAPLAATNNSTKFCIGLKATITTWTGAANNGNWNTAGNWSNGIPTNETKAVFNSSATNFPTTNLPTTNGPAIVEIHNGATLSLPSTFVIPIVNNGTIEVKMATPGDIFYGFGSSSKFSMPTGTGTVRISDNIIKKIDGYYFGNNISNSVDINLPAGVSLVRTLNIGGNLSLTNGIVTPASGQTLNITNPTATVTGNANAYINGKLIRNINANGTYTFPVGAGSTYAPATITLNNVAGPTNINATFTAAAPSGQPNITIGSNNITSTLAAGWEISPSAPLTGGSYNISLSAPVGSSTATNFAVLKRPHTWSGSSDWTAPGTQTSSVTAGVVTATATGLTSFSQFALGELPAGPLPVTLVKFTAKAESNSVLLNWETASEQNSNKFVVERSTDGITFLPVDYIKAKGSSNTLTTYTIRDKNPLSGTSYYRLKMVDLDGTFEYSKLYVVNFKINELGIALYPNPASDKILFTGLNGKKGSLALYSQNGQKVTMLKLENNEVIIPSSINSGTYIIKLVLDHGTQYSQKVLIKKY